MIRRNTNRKHMSDDHHGRRTEEATLLARAADEILGTHSTITTFCVDITCSTSYTVVVMAKRNLTIQLDEATIRHAKIVAAHRGLSLSSLVAQQLNELAEADQRYERARAVALGALADASGGAAPSWRREELYDR